MLFIKSHLNSAQLDQRGFVLGGGHALGGFLTKKVNSLNFKDVNQVICKAEVRKVCLMTPAIDSWAPAIDSWYCHWVFFSTHVTRLNFCCFFVVVDTGVAFLEYVTKPSFVCLDRSNYPLYPYVNLGISNLAPGRPLSTCLDIRLRCPYYGVLRLLHSHHCSALPYFKLLQHRFEWDL